MEPISILIIVVLYLIATFFGSMIGGAGLLTVPMLIFFGLSPHTSLGTNKIGAFGQSTGASIGFGLEKKIDYKVGFLFMAFVIVGAVIGSLTVLSLPGFVIEKIIGFIMIIVVILLFFNKSLCIKITKIKRNLTWFIVFALASGFYNGFYGGGIGTINRIVISAFFAYTIIRSSAISSFAGSATNLLTFSIFALNGAVEYSLIIPILLASLTGGYLGSKYAVKIGNENVKRILLVVAIIMAIKLLFF